MASENEMRVGDAEREAAAAELREHYASGRLTLDELNERVEAAFAAKTRADLNALMTDLPSARPGGSGSPGWTGAGGQAGPTRGRGAFGPGGGPWGPGGPFGPSGPHGPGGPLGPGIGWDKGSGSGAGYRCGPARTAGAMFSTLLVMAALFTVGVLGVFGVFGGGRPIGIVLIIAAFALLRRLFFGLFGRRRVRSRGPRGRRR
jgi:Domain of unknown function (DUF1707)